MSILVLPSFSSDDFFWPCMDKILISQAEYAVLQPSEVSIAEDGLYITDNDTLWIPDVAEDPHLFLRVIAHTRPSGHRSADTTERVRAKYFTWSTLSADINIFLHSCLHCPSTVGGGKVPRPHGPAVHGTAPKDLPSSTTLRLHRKLWAKSTF